MLMTMEKIARLCTVYVFNESVETLMNICVTFVDSTR